MENDKLDRMAATHLLSARNFDEFQRFERTMPKKPNDPSAAEDWEADLAKFEKAAKAAPKALGGAIKDDESLAAAKTRLLVLMEESSKLIGHSSSGEVLPVDEYLASSGRGVQGRLMAEGLREILAPDRPHKAGTLFALRQASGGAMPSASDKPLNAKGDIALPASRFASLAVGRIADAVGGFGLVWEAAAECESARVRLGSIDGANGSEAWSREAVRESLSQVFEGKLEPFLPVDSTAFPDADGSAILSKLSERRAAAGLGQESKANVQAKR